MVEIEETFAEAFGAQAIRLLITADTEETALETAQNIIGFGVSMIMCPVEAGIEGPRPEKTPDGRPGVFVSIYAGGKKTALKELLARLIWVALPAEGVSVYDYLENPEKMLNVGDTLKDLLGDQAVATQDSRGREGITIKNGEGSFFMNTEFGILKGVAGGNLLVYGKDDKSALDAAEKALEALLTVPAIVATFPGGLCRSGSKVGSIKYPFLPASTNHLFCPVLKNEFEDSQIDPETNSVIELVLNGLDDQSLLKSMGLAIKAIKDMPGLNKITAVNFEGKLGKYLLHLKDALAAVS